MVSKDGVDQPNQQVLAVKQLKETAGYVERMPGGVRGGGREAPLYSIFKILISNHILTRLRLNIAAINLHN